MAVDEIACDGSWLWKGLQSAGGLQVARWRSVAGDPTAAQTPAAHSPPANRHYFQRHVAGQSVSAIYLAAQGQALLLGVTEQLLATADGTIDWNLGEAVAGDCFRYAGSIGPVLLDERLTGVFSEIGSALAAEFDLAGLFGVDAVVTGETVWPVEVNPRYTASVEVIERATGATLLALHDAACRDGVLPPTARLSAGCIVGKAILVASRHLVAGGSSPAH